MYILPEPQIIEYGCGEFFLRFDGKIVIHNSCDTSVLFYAEILKGEIEKDTSFDYMITRGDTVSGNIFLNMDKMLEEETYKLIIDERGVHISGGSKQAVLYGIQTLRQIIAQNGIMLPYISILDYPAMKNRGFYHDATRGRIPTLTYLKTLADKLSYYKINQLQLYVEHSFLFEGLSEVWRDDTPLTAEEILELDNYCNKLNIELVPSLASFGHLYKLLRTKSYSQLCELTDLVNSPFSFIERMQHHTINTSMEESYKLVEALILEFMPLFTSKQFNICADETFDLGKGSSKPLADEIGIKNMYINYVNRLCTFLLDQGKRPMIWGDIISDFPEAIEKLPEDTIYLTWGYAANQNDTSVKRLSDVGATQYVCPGVGGWNRFINLLESSYSNIRKMCAYAEKYKAIGILNTDWGDYGHINHPEFSTTGIIYGAAFSWKHNILEFEEINKQISKIEYTDHTEKFVSLINEISKRTVFGWEQAVKYMEVWNSKSFDRECRDFFSERESRLRKIESINEEIDNFLKKLNNCLITMDTSKRRLMKAYYVAAEGIKLFNCIGAVVGRGYYNTEGEEIIEPKELAKKLEYWLYSYKQVWRSISKESELYRIQNVMLWYADILRNISASGK